MKRRLLIALGLIMVTTLASWFVAYAWPPGDCLYSGVCCVEPELCDGQSLLFCQEEWYCPEYSYLSCGCCDQSGQP
jgi:hypothetical protein